MEDYSMFSQEAIQRSLEEMLEQVQRETGATREQVNLAFAEAAQRFIDTNFMKEPKERS